MTPPKSERGATVVGAVMFVIMLSAAALIVAEFIKGLF